MKAFILGVLRSRPLRRLGVGNPIVLARAQALYAQAQGVRWDVFFTRVAFAFSLIAGLGSVGALLVTLSCLVPGRTGVVVAAIGGSVAAVSGCCAALGPRMTKAAGICTQAREQQRPLWPTLKDIAALFADAPRIVRAAEAQREADALRAEGQRRQAEQDRARREAEENRAALVADVMKEVGAIVERSKSFRVTPDGLVEDGILAALKAADPTGQTPPAPVAAEESDDDEAAPSSDKASQDKASGDAASGAPTL